MLVFTVFIRVMVVPFLKMVFSVVSFIFSRQGFPVYVALAVLELRDPSASASQVLGLKACNSTAWLKIRFLITSICSCHSTGQVPPESALQLEQVSDILLASLALLSPHLLLALGSTICLTHLTSCLSLCSPNQPT